MGSISNDTSMQGSSNEVTFGGAVGGVVSFLLVVILCIIIVLYVRHWYKKKKAAYLVNHAVHFKPESHVTFYPDLYYDTVNEGHRRADTAVDNDYNIITNCTSATNAGK